MPSSRWLLAWAALAFASGAGAQEFRDSIRVFAERAPLLETRGAQAITVITRQQIDERQPASLVELLSQVAGLHVDRLGNAGGTSNLYVRGADPNHTIVLVDGVRMNDPTDVRGGSVDLGSIAIGEVERIEVLRGASSARFGADAIGGVINIVTRADATGPRARAWAAAGGSGHRDAGLAGGAPIGAATVAGRAAYQRDGRDADGGSVRRHSAGAQLGWAGAGRQLRLQVRRAEGEASSFPESSGGVRLATSRELEHRDTRETTAALSFGANLGGTWRVDAGVHRLDRREDRVSPGVASGPGGLVPAGTSHTDFERSSVFAQATWTHPMATLLLGAESIRERGERASVLDLGAPVPGEFRQQRDMTGGYVQAEGDLARLRWSAAARRDAVEDGVRRTSRSAGARYALAGDAGVRVHWSEGFKPPSFFALADPFVGNPDLGPETSTTREAGIDHRAGALRWEATAFDTRYRGLVDFDPETFRMVNRAGARARGAEAAIALDLGPTQLRAAYTHVETRLLGSDAAVRNRPRDRASIGALHRVGAFSVDASVVHTGDSFDFAVPTGEVRLRGHTVGHVALRWKRGAVGAFLAIDNVTDRRHESFVGFTAPGRRLRLGVQLEP